MRSLSLLALILVVACDSPTAPVAKVSANVVSDTVCVSHRGRTNTAPPVITCTVNNH